MGDRWRPDTGQQWLRDTDKRIDMLERRTVRSAGPNSLALGAGAMNKIINGDFRINQRRYVSGATLTPGLLPGYGHDRWRTSGSTNLVRNPRVGTNVTDWNIYGATGAGARQTTGGPAGASTFYRLTLSAALAAGGGGIYIAEAGIPVQDGVTYVVSAWMRASTAGTGELAMQPFGAGSAVGSIILGNGAVAANTWTRIVGTLVAPAGATGLRLHFRYSALASGATLDVTGARVSEYTGSPDLVNYFDGDTGTWLGTAHASQSINRSTLTSYTFTQAPNGCTITLNSGGGIYQVIERANMPAGRYTVSWEGTAQTTIGGSASIRNRMGNPDTVVGGLGFGISGATGSFTPPGVVGGPVVRRNMVRDPRTTATAQWIATNTALSIVGGYMRSTANGAGPAALNPLLLAGSAASAAGSAAANDPFAYQVKVKQTGVPQYVRPRIGYAESTGVEIGSLGMSPLVQTVPAGSGDTTLTFVGVLPNNPNISRLTAAVYFYSSVAAANPPAGQVNEFTQLLVDVGSLAPLTTGAVVYFDGSTPDGTGLGSNQYDWTGTADASASTTALGVAGGKFRATAIGGSLPYFYPNTPANEGPGRYAVTPGDKITWRTEVTNPNLFTVYARPGTYFYDIAGTQLAGTITGPFVAIPPGETVVVEQVGLTTPSTAGLVGMLPLILFYLSGGGLTPSAGALMDTTKWALFTGADATSLDPAEPVPYFSGASTIPGYATAWLGPANVSASTKTAVFTSPASFDVDGTGDVTIEFVAVGGAATLGKVTVAVGAAPYPFEPRLIGEELLLAQRYYWRSPEGSAVGTQLGPMGTTNNTTTAVLHHELSVPMRILPVLEWTTTLGVSDLITLSAVVTAMSINPISRGSILRLDTTYSAGGGTVGRPALLRSAGANNWIAYSAEF